MSQTLPPTGSSGKAPRARWGVFLAVIAGGGLTLGLLAIFALPTLEPPAQTTYHVAIHQSTSELEHWIVEVPKSATKSQITEVAQQLLSNAPVGRERRIEFLQEKKGPFTPTYASVQLEPGQSGGGLQVFFHMH